MSAAAVMAAAGVAGAAPGAAAGDIVSARPLPEAAQVNVVTLPGAADSVHFVYRTTGVRNLPATSSGAVYFPAGAPPKGGFPVLAFAHGTVGLADRCSYTTSGASTKVRDANFLGTWLRLGYAIVITDYVGLGSTGNHPYMNGPVLAHNLIDAVKAAVGKYPARLSRKWAAVGVSEGATATLYAAKAATSYGGNKLDYRGAVAIGLPAHVEDVLMALGPGTPSVALLPNMTQYALDLLSGLRTSYPELDINSYLTPSGRYWIDRAEQLCANDIMAELNDQAVVLGNLMAKPLAALPNARALLAGYLGAPESGYDRPVFIGHGIRDIDVITPGTWLTVAALQANHEPVTFHSYGSDHAGTFTIALRDAIPFVRGIF
ncbi:MAG: lipase [Mycobacteriaceae bacterium]|nr:lipase [Mycobacteriaceae bacterium]